MSPYAGRILLLRDERHSRAVVTQKTVETSLISTKMTGGLSAIA